MAQNCQKINCTFAHSPFSNEDNESFYTCEVLYQQMPVDDKFQFYGTHSFFRSNYSVTHVKFENCTVSKIPQGLMKTFPYMKILTIKNSKLKNLHKNDLADYKKLERIILDENVIEFLPGNLFDYFINLEWISFKDNKLEVIEPNILNKLSRLKYVNFLKNPNHDRHFTAYPNQIPKHRILEIRNYLFEKFNVSVPAVYYQEVLKLRDSEQKLMEEVGKLKETTKIYNLNAYQMDECKRTIFQEIQTLQKSKYKLKQEVQILSSSKYNLSEDVQELECFKELLNQEVETIKSTKQKLNQEIEKMRISEQVLNQEIRVLKNNKLKVSKIRDKRTENSLKIIENSMLNDLNNYVKDENFKDFKIEIGNQEFLVHKSLLTMRSPTLAEMLRQNPYAENLKLVDIPVEVFEAILNFLYTDELPQKEDMNFMHVFAAARRLGINKLENYAAAIIMDQINDENSIEILEFSNKYGHDELRRKAFEKVKKKYHKIEFKDEWAMNTEKIKKMIEFFKKMEAIEREFFSDMD